VLLNGGPGLSLHAFVPHFSPAAEFARLIYYDPRGVGRSEWKPEDGYNVAQALLDLEDLRGQLGIESWVVLGWSWGAHLARLYALCYPERVRGLVLVSALADLEARQRPRTPTHHTVDEAKRIRACFTYKGKLAKAAHSDSVPLHQVQRMVYNALRNGEWKRKYFIRPTDERLSQIAQHEWVHDLNYTRGMRRSADIRLKGAFAATPFATLIIDGRWDMTFPPDKGRLLALEIDGSREVILENASHHVFAEEPGRFFELLEEFVAQPAPDAGRLHAWREHTAPWADKILGGDGGG
jgi:pimeloyl-ACP methyl ester carboxylesterase